MSTTTLLRERIDPAPSSWCVGEVLRWRAQPPFAPFGRWSVLISEIVTALELMGRNVSYVPEQDTAITDEDSLAMAGPRLDAKDTIEFSRGLDVDFSAQPRPTKPAREG